MLLHNKQRINTKKKYLAGFIKSLDAFMSTPHPPYCNILTNKKRCRLEFIICYYISGKWKYFLKKIPCQIYVTIPNPTRVPVPIMLIC